MNIQLDEKSVDIKELTPNLVVKIWKTIGGLTAEDISNMDIVKNYDTVISILNQIVIVNDGDASVGDLQFSEIDTILPHVLEVNKSFLERLKQMGLDLPLMQE